MSGTRDSDVAALSGGRPALRLGTRYGALDRLTDEGLVEPNRERMWSKDDYSATTGSPARAGIRARPVSGAGGR
ncbi:hypothetical protein [Micromonospora sp. NPDC023814]|uniref:hypothetical protein n=1 Tax=Micromonospora sp. NPDC023814 TaxID=3154596 RepID=UPI0033F682C3